MENVNLDKATVDMLANSSLEMSNPYFNSIITNKIMQKEKQKSVVRYILFCSLFIIAIAAVIILLLQPGHSGSLIVPEGFSTFNSSIMINTTNAGNWFIENLYFILPVLILLLVKNIIDSKLRHL